MTLENLARRVSNTKDTRRLLEMAFHQTRMAMCVTDPHEPDNPIIAINGAFTRMTGYEEDEILGRNCRFLQGEATDEGEVQRIRDAIRTREITTFELLNYKKDGTPFWNALHVGPVFSDEGELLFFFGSQWDITDKMETIRALEGKVRVKDERLQGAFDEAARLRQSVDQANDAMILTDYAPIDPPGPRIVWVNGGFERMTGYSRDEVIGKTPRMLQGPETDPASLDRVRTALEDGRGLPASETLNYRKDGSTFHLEWTITPIAGTDGAPRYWLSVQRDVSERIETEQRLRVLSDELNHRHKNVFSLVGALQQLLPTEGLTAAEYRDALGARMRALNAAHDAVFTADGRLGPTTDLRAVIDAVIAPFETRRLHLDAEDGAAIAAKPALDLSMVLHELVTNAAKHGALSVPSGRVDLRLRVADGMLALDWRERDGPPVSEPERKGFGRKLLDGLAGAHGGLVFDPSGLRYSTEIGLR